MLDGQRGQVGVRDQIPTQVTFDDEPPENLGVPFTWLRQPTGVRSEPVLYVRPGTCRRKGVGGRSWVGRDALEREQRGPREPYPTGAIERSL